MKEKKEKVTGKPKKYKTKKDVRLQEEQKIREGKERIEFKFLLREQDKEFDFLEFVQLKRNELEEKDEQRAELRRSLLLLEQQETSSSWKENLEIRKKKLRLEYELESFEGLTTGQFDRKTEPLVRLFVRGAESKVLIQRLEAEVFNLRAPVETLEVKDEEGGNDVCLCGAEFVERDQCFLVCLVCGFEKHFVEATSVPITQVDEPSVVIAPPVYVKSNHLAEHLNHLQFRETTRVAPEFIHLVKNELEIKYPTIPIKEIPFKKCDECLRSLKKSEFYEHSMQIWCRITDKPPVRFDPVTEEEIGVFFEKIQAPWERHKPPGRQSFMSYGYVVIKALQKYKKLETYKPYLRMLKGPHVAKTLETVMANMFLDLGWQDFEPIPPDMVDTSKLVERKKKKDKPDKKDKPPTAKPPKKRAPPETLETPPETPLQTPLQQTPEIQEKGTRKNKRAKIK